MSVHVECSDPRVLAEHQGAGKARDVEFYDPGVIREGWREKCMTEDAGWFANAIDNGCRYRLCFSSPEEAGRLLVDYRDRLGAQVEWRRPWDETWIPSGEVGCGVDAVVANLRSHPDSYRIAGPAPVPSTPEAPEPALTLGQRSMVWRLQKDYFTDPVKMCAKLLEEAGEVARAVIGEDEQREGRGDPVQEAAQTVILLATIVEAVRPGTDLLTAVEDEMERAGNGPVPSPPEPPEPRTERVPWWEAVEQRRHIGNETVEGVRWDEGDIVLFGDCEVEIDGAVAAPDGTVEVLVRETQP